MKKLISAFILILIIVGTFGACNSHSKSKDDFSTKSESETSITEINEMEPVVSKFDKIKSNIKNNFVSDEAAEIYNLIISSDTVSGSTYEKICEFLANSSSSVDDLNPCTKVFKISENCQLEINGRNLLITVSKDSNVIERVHLLDNVDVFNIGKDRLTVLSDFTLYNGVVYQYGRSFYNLYGDDYSVIKNINPNNLVLQYGNVLTVVQIATEKNGKISSVTENIITEDCKNPIYIRTLSMDIESVSAACEMNSLFYQKKNNEIIHYNLLSKKTNVICDDSDCILLSDASGIYWLDTEKAANYVVYNIPSSSPDAEMFIGHPSTIINWSGEEVNFSFNDLI